MKLRLSQMKTFLGLGIGAVALIAMFQNCAPAKHAPGDDGLSAAISPKAHESDPALLAATVGDWKVSEYEVSPSCSSEKVCAQVQRIIKPDDLKLIIDSNGGVIAVSACHRLVAQASVYAVPAGEAPHYAPDASFFVLSDANVNQSADCDAARLNESLTLMKGLQESKYIVSDGATRTVFTENGTLILE